MSGVEKMGGEFGDYSLFTAPSMSGARKQIWRKFKEFALTRIVKNYRKYFGATSL
ncbi:hypothetical protein [Microbulbifer sp. THAF38]|uniref:hypothetical protein n=1 Tax=Microbulbifer sp. THAF38 TaxID=2587856 RepID=UPI001562CF60|nr:hypothetical protein [Microbulbifer sp. THAF38]